MGYLFLEDTEVQKHAPVGRMLTKEDMQELYPMRPPRKIPFVFKYQKPLDMNMECRRKGLQQTDVPVITKKLLDKYDSIVISEHSPVQEVDLQDMTIQDLRSLGMRYGIQWDDLTVPKEDVIDMIYQCRAAGLTPKTEEEWAAIKKESKAKPVKPFKELI